MMRNLPVMVLAAFLCLASICSSANEAASFEEEWETYIQPKHAIEISYPAKWFRTEHFPSDLYQLFLSREKVGKPGDVFLVGVSLTKIYRGSEVAGLRSNHPLPMAAAFMQTYMKHVESPITKYAETIPVQTGDGAAYLSDLAFRDVYGKDIRVWIVVGYDPKNDVAVTVNLEAPEKEFEGQKATFDRIVKSIKLFYTNPAQNSRGLPDLRFSQIMLSGFANDNAEIEKMSPAQRTKYFQVWPEAKTAYEKSRNQKE